MRARIAWPEVAAITAASLCGLYYVRTFDTFFHLASGRFILEHGEVPVTDPFSFTFRGAPWHNHSWGYQLLLAALHALGGFPLLSVLQALLAGCTAGLGAWALRRQLAGSARAEPDSSPLLSRARGRSLHRALAGWAAVLAALPAAAFREVLEARPHMLGFVCLSASLLVALDVYRSGNPRTLGWLWPLYLVWVVSHGSHLLIFVILGCALLACLLERRTELLKGFGLAALVLLLSGLSLAPQAFQQGGEHLGSSFLESSVREWAPVTAEVLFSSFQGRTFLLLGMLSVLGSARMPVEAGGSARERHVEAGGSARERHVEAGGSARERHVESPSLAQLGSGLFPRLLLAVFVLLGFTSLRMLALFSLGASPLWLPFSARAASRLTSLAGRERAALWARVLPMPTLLVLLGMCFFSGRTTYRFGAGLMEERLPTAALASLRQRGRLARLYNAYNFGGYLIWERTPSAGVFVDGRALTVYPEAFLKAFDRAYLDMSVFEQLARRFAIDGVLLPTHSARTQRLLHYLQRNPRYRLVHRDEVASLFELVAVEARPRARE